VINKRENSFIKFTNLILQNCKLSYICQLNWFFENLKLFDASIQITKKILRVYRESLSTLQNKKI